MSDFKHISVTAAEDDEIIVVGASDRGQSQPREREALGGAAEAEVPAAEQAVREPAVQAPGEDVGKAAKASDEGAGNEDARTSDAAKSADGIADERSRAPKDDGYRETTLEDLEPSSMPTAQRIVIIAAVVCIIGALIYYFAFMR